MQSKSFTGAAIKRKYEFSIYKAISFLLIPNGMGLKYIKTESVLAVIGSDLLIVLPVIYARTRVLKRYDVTVY